MRAAKTGNGWMTPLSGRLRIFSYHNNFTLIFNDDSTAPVQLIRHLSEQAYHQRAIRSISLTISAASVVTPSVGGLTSSSSGKSAVYNVPTNVWEGGIIGFAFPTKEGEALQLPSVVVGVDSHAA